MSNVYSYWIPPDYIFYVGQTVRHLFCQENVYFNIIDFILVWAKDFGYSFSIVTAVL